MPLFLPLCDQVGTINSLVAVVTNNMTLATPAIVATYEYEPFGELIAQTGPYANSCPFSFQTKYRDCETGLSYYGYRFYDPKTGKWLTTDPFQEEGGLNLTAFCSNDPVNNTDPLGLASESEWGVNAGIMLSWGDHNHYSIFHPAGGYFLTASARYGLGGDNFAGLNAGIVGLGSGSGTPVNSTEDKIWKIIYFGASATQRRGTGEATPTFPGVPGIVGALENKFGQSATFGLNRYWSDLLEQGSPQGRGGHWAYVVEGKSADAFFRVGEDFRPLASLGFWDQSDIGLTADAIIGKSQGNGNYIAAGFDIFSGWYDLNPKGENGLPIIKAPDYPGYSGWTAWNQTPVDRNANKGEYFLLTGDRFFSAKFAVSPSVPANPLMIAHDKFLGCGGLYFSETPLDFDLTLMPLFRR